MGQEEMGWCRICEAVSGRQGETPATLPTAGHPRRDRLAADSCRPGLSVNMTGRGSANTAGSPRDEQGFSAPPTGSLKKISSPH